MNSGVNIRDLSSLEQLKISIGKFYEVSENQLHTIDSKLLTRFGNLKSLESKFQRMIEVAEVDLQNANRALSSCESNTYEDEDGNIEPPNCDFEREEMIDCKRRLAQAEFKYNSFKRELKKLEKAIEEYQNPRVKYKTLIQFENESAISSLKQLITGAEDYLSVSSPFTNGFSNGLELTEVIAKMDPTLVLAATVGVAEVMIMSIFSFFGIEGNSHEVTNKNENGLITTTFSENGTDHVCSQLKIEKPETGNMGKILSVNIPPSLKNGKIGTHLINNLETTCRANDCKEISGWVSKENLGFYRGIGYQTRNEVKDTGAEVFKPLESNFYATQKNAKAAFENVDQFKFKTNTGPQLVNPLKIISPDEINDEIFWKQHDREGMERYINQIEKYDNCREMLKNGKTLDEIKKNDFSSAIAYENFISKGDTIRLQRNGDYYRIDGGGRHRVAAAQVYFLRTGKIVPIDAEVSE